MSRRSEKVASLLKEVVSEIIVHNLKDPVFRQFISITDVKIGEDLKKATFYFRVYQGDEKQIETALNKAKGYIKKLIAEKIVIKFIPDIEFKPDDTLEKEKRMEELFQKIAKMKGSGQ